MISNVIQKFANPCTRTGKIHAVREEVAGVRNQHDQTALNLGHPTDMCVLQGQSSPDPDENANQHAAKEHQQEKADSLKQVQNRQ